jgi:predicted regulator of Ras-like GTPase activity (Roadblock/LC7/MglB family)
MADPNADAAIERLMSLSTDVRAAVLVDGRGQPLACSEEGPRAGEMAHLASQLFEQARELPGDQVDQLEAQVDAGAVYAVYESGYTLAAVADRAALSSLMFYDLRAALAALSEQGA